MSKKKRKKLEKYIVSGSLEFYFGLCDSNQVIGTKIEKRCSCWSFRETFVSFLFIPKMVLFAYWFYVLSTASWSSDLLKSSKLIGRSGQTLREQLRQAMLEQKAGITPTDESVPLVVEKEIDELPPMPEISTTVEEPKVQSVIGSALKDGPSMPLVKKKRKKKQVSNLISPQFYSVTKNIT